MKTWLALLWVPTLVLGQEDPGLEFKHVQTTVVDQHDTVAEVEHPDGTRTVTMQNEAGETESVTLPGGRQSNATVDTSFFQTAGEFGYVYTINNLGETLVDGLILGIEANDSIRYGNCPMDWWHPGPTVIWGPRMGKTGIPYMGIAGPFELFSTRGPGLHLAAIHEPIRGLTMNMLPETQDRLRRDGLLEDTKLYNMVLTFAPVMELTEDHEAIAQHVHDQLDIAMGAEQFAPLRQYLVEMRSAEYSELYAGFSRLRNRIPDGDKNAQLMERFVQAMFETMDWHPANNRR